MPFFVADVCLTSWCEAGLQGLLLSLLRFLEQRPEFTAEGVSGGAFWQHVCCWSAAVMALMVLEQALLQRPLLLEGSAPGVTLHDQSHAVREPTGRKRVKFGSAEVQCCWRPFGHLRALWHQLGIVECIGTANLAFLPASMRHDCSLACWFL